MQTKPWSQTQVANRLPEFRTDFTMAEGYYASIRKNPNRRKVVNAMARKKSDSVWGREVATRRRKLGLSQPRFAEIIGVSEQSISRWENGKNPPNSWLLVDLALRWLEHEQASRQDAVATT